MENRFIFYKKYKDFEIGFSNKNFNFESFFKNKKIAILKQIHSRRIIKVNSSSEYEEKSDGLLTTEDNLYLIIQTADCYPVLAFNRKADFIGAVHAGWRGIYKNILGELKKTILTFADKEITEKNTEFFIGPGICKNCYEIKKDVYDKFKQNNLNKSIFEFSSDKIFLDLRKAIMNQLKNLNFKTKNIKNFNICTFENKDLISYRKNKTKGRLYNFIRKGYFKEGIINE